MDSSINFQSIFHALPTAYLVVGPDLTIVDVNHACLRRFDKTKEEVTGRRLSELLPQATESTGIGKLNESYHETLEKKTPVSLQSVIFSSAGPAAGAQAGADRYCAISHVPVLDDDGALRWIITQIDEISGDALAAAKGLPLFPPSSPVRSAPPPWIKPTREASGSLATHSPSLNVLLVEDNEDLKETTATVIEALGHRVVAVDNAERALELLATESFDVLFTDLSLPKTTGAELAREALNRYPSMRVIITSGYGRAMANARNLDAVFLPKPYQLVDIQSALDGTTAPNY